MCEEEFCVCCSSPTLTDIVCRLCSHQKPETNLRSDGSVDRLTVELHASVQFDPLSRASGPIGK